MRTVLVTPATFQPMEVEEIKDRPELRISGTDDDLTIVAMLQSAINAYEDYTGHILCRSTWDLYMDEWPDDDDDESEIELPAPLASVSSITYLDTDGASQTFAASKYIVDTTNPVMGRIALAYNQSWPDTYAQINAITIRFLAGYADPSDIPSRVKDGLLLKIQELYDGVDRSAIYEGCWMADRRIPV